MMHRLYRDEGYTLIELLVVVAMVGLLVALAVPKLHSALDRARLTSGQADLVVITSALERYDVDYLTYPNGDSADEVMAALRGGYLKPTTTYHNGFNQGYLYLLSDDARRYWLIDLRGEQQDDDPGTPGQQIIIWCSDGDPANDIERVFTVQQGPGATLTLPAVQTPGDPWQVPYWMWDYCEFLHPNPNFAVVKH